MIEDDREELINDESLSLRQGCRQWLAERRLRCQMGMKTTPQIGTVTLVILVAFLSGSVFIHGFMSRILGLTMVCIVDPDYLHKNTTNKTVDNPCGYHELQPTNTSSDHGYHGTFKWNAIDQSNVVAFHNWARFIWLPFSGFVIRMFNETQVFGAATLLCIIVTALFPISAIHGGWKGALAIRFILGSGHAFSSPCLDQIVAHYVPKRVKSTAYAFITAGSQIAVFVGSPLGAYFCLHTFWGGWPAIFYVAALIAAGWLIAWEIFTINLFYCRSRSSKTFYVDGGNNSGLQDDLQPKEKSYREMFKDFYENIIKEKAVYGLFPCDVAATWTITLYIYYIPQFYRDVLKISLQNNGYFSALPFLVQMLSKIFVSMLADAMKKYTPLSDTVISKIFNTIGMIGSGFCLLITVVVCMSGQTAIALVCIGYGLYSCTTPGFRTSLISINREWTAVISACCTIFAMIGGIVFPYIFGAVVHSGASKEWKILFGIMFALDIVAAAAYVVLGSLEGKKERSIEAAEQMGKDQ